MTIGLSLSLTLGAGLYADGGPVVLKQQFVAAWGRTEVFVANATPWDIARERAWNNHTLWSIRFAFNHQVGYGMRLESQQHCAYSDMRLHRRRWQAAYGDRARVRVRHLSPYTDLGRVRRRFRTGYWLTQSLAASHALGYAITDVDPVASRLTSSWSLLDDARLQAVVNSPELIWQDQRIRIVQATLSCDEGSPVWIARIEIAEVSDFARMSIGDTLMLALGLERFALVIDGKTLSRESRADPRCELTAVSPVALLDAPFAGTGRYYEAAAMQARAMVERLIGSVDWQLPDWLIPPGRLQFDNVTPLTAARNLVAAIGGIVESDPDGSVVCRRLHPVSIPDYATTIPAGSLFDADVISARAQIAPRRGFNRLTIANEEGASSSHSADRIEYVVDADNPNQGTVRAYLALQRPVQLVHTGNAATVIGSQGEVTRTEAELIEFIEGGSELRYPVTAITSAVWQHADLGPVTANQQSLAAAVPGYSLLRLTYTTTSLNWRVALAADEEVQFVLVDS